MYRWFDSALATTNIVQTAQLPGWAFCFLDSAFCDLPENLDPYFSSMRAAPRSPYSLYSVASAIPAA